MIKLLPGPVLGRVRLATSTLFTPEAVETGEGPASQEPEGPKDGFKSGEGRWGTREIEITNVAISGPGGEAGHVFQSGDPLHIRLDVTSKETIIDFVFGLGLFNADNVCVYGTNTNLEEFQPTEIDGEA